MRRWGDLAWVKINAGVWVDRDGFYCIRLCTGDHGWTDFAGLPAYEAHETYPACPVVVIGVGGDLRDAKKICQLHADRLMGRKEAA